LLIKSTNRGEGNCGMGFVLISISKIKNSKRHQPTYKEISADIKFLVLKKKFFISWDCP
jgi:hypothetical protein